MSGGMEMKEYDLFVIGTGVAGGRIAVRCSGAGWNVAVADYLPFGGACPLRGCNPKEVLWNCEEVVERASNLTGKGIAGDIRINWGELIRFKRKFTGPVAEDRENTFKEKGITAYHGRAVFVGRNRVKVEGEAISARRIVIAAGAKPRNLGVPGGEHLVTSDRFMELEELPAGIIFAGGGYISFEFASLAVRAGAAVTILNDDDRPLAVFERSIVERGVAAFRKRGINIILNKPVAEIRKIGAKYRVTAGSESDEIFETDMVVHGAGRVPNIDDLELEWGKIEVNNGQIAVNKYLQSTTNESVYIAGDVNKGGIQLTPVAAMEAAVVTENLLKGNCVQPDYSVVPSVVYTIPPIASVGLTEEQAGERELDYEVKKGDCSRWESVRKEGIEAGAYAIVLERDSGRLLGAHLMLPKAEEIINLFALAIRQRLTAGRLKEMIWSFPSHSYELKRMLR